MNIGIDGGALSITDDRLKVGVYRVAYNLVKELPRIDVKSFYRVYSFGRGGENRLRNRQNVSFIRLPQPGFQKIWQPLELMCNPVDTYLGVSQSLPITLYDVFKIGFIYDVGFLEHPEFYRESYFALTSQTTDVVRRAHHIITISEASSRSIQRTYHVPKKKLTVSYLGIEKVFRPTGKTYRTNHPYFLFVGALKPGKNVPLMLAAFAEFLKTSRKIYDFLLVGSDYWLDPEILSTISVLGLRSRVHMMGFVDDSTLATYYRGATTFVSASRIEGFGLPVVEAMASGCPVIASTSGSYPEVVGSAGILVEPGKESELANAMGMMTTNRAKREKLVTLGLARAKLFSWQKFAHTVYEIASVRS